MFNLNECNRIVMAQHPSYIRIGVNGLCGQVGCFRMVTSEMFGSTDIVRV